MEGFGVGDESHLWGLWGRWKNTRGAVDRAEVGLGHRDVLLATHCIP